VLSGDRAHSIVCDVLFRLMLLFLLMLHGLKFEIGIVRRAPRNTEAVVTDLRKERKETGNILSRIQME
jgi:predicted PurR-regulated permease PerM